MTAAGSPRPPAPWLAALLSLAHPGLGYIYLGRARLGVAIWVGTWAAMGLALWLASRLPGGVAIVLLASVVLAGTLGVAARSGRAARQRSGSPRPHAGTVVLAFVALTAANVIARAWLHRHVADTYRIPSGGMAPAVEAGDWIFVAPLRSRPRAGQVVTYVSELSSRVKRIAALPGDTIEMRHGRLIRNGSAVVEPYTIVGDSLDYTDSAFAWQRAFLVDSANRAGYRPTIDTWGPLAVPADDVFVLGDNRHASEDSRHVGFIPVRNIFGNPTSVYMSWDAESSHVRWGRIGRAIR